MYSNFIKNKEQLQKERTLRNNAKTKIIVCFIFALFFYLVYYFIYSYANVSMINIIIYMISIIIVEVAILDILDKGVKIYNVFGVNYFLFLAINNFNISRLQNEKTLTDVYYLIFGALLFMLTLWSFEQIMVKHYIKAKQTINPNTIAKVIFAIAVVLKLLVFMQTGSRLVNADWASDQGGTKYSVGGLSGLAEMAIWISLMLVPQVKEYLKIIISVSAIVLFGIFSISRNNIMMMLIFLILCFAQSKGKKLLINKKTTRMLMFALIIVVIGFTVFGNYRQRMRGWTDPGQVIAYLLQSNFNNSAINWLYSYTAINFDVLLQIMVNSMHTYTSYSIGAPFIRLIAGNNALLNFYDAVYHIDGLNGFNGSTLFGPMIYEMGPLYVIGAFLLGLQVGFLSYIARSENSKGHYAYLMVFSALAIFGNFFSIPIYFYISIVACVIFPFISQNKIN